MDLLYHLGRYFMLLGKVFSWPEKLSVYTTQLKHDMFEIGIKSLGLVTLISVFMGAVISIQMAANITSPIIPKYTVGYGTRQSIILEFAPTIIALILAGRVGSSIASEIGSMRVTEQIDALEIMGVNPASFLILPKMLAAFIINPFLIIYSMFLGICGGWFSVVSSGYMSSHQFISGVQFQFDPFTVTYAIIKTLFFAIIMTTIPAYQGYYTKGGSLEVGRSSTKGVVYSSIVILLLDLILTKMLLL